MINNKLYILQGQKELDSAWRAQTEADLNTQFPVHLKNLLTMTGFDNILSMSFFHEIHISDLEYLEATITR